MSIAVLTWHMSCVPDHMTFDVHTPAGVPGLSLVGLPCTIPVAPEAELRLS